MVDINELKNQIKQITGQTIYGRGLDYFNRGLVNTIEILGYYENKLIIKGLVKGTQNYKSDIIFDIGNNKFRSFDCNCPYNFDCKHSVALALRFVELYSDFSESIENYDLEKEVFTEELTDFIKRKSRDITNSIITETEKPIEKEFDISDYYLNISFFGSHVNLTLYNFDSPYFYDYNRDSSDILGKYKNSLSDKEKIFFELLSKHNNYSYTYSPDNNIGEILRLAQEIKIKIYKDKKELKFIKKPGKIKAELKVSKRYSYSEDDYFDVFVFALDKKHKKTQFVKSAEGLIALKNNNILSYNLSPELSEIISRIDLIGKKATRYYDKNEDEKDINSFQTELNEDEMLKINEILSDSKKQLDFSTTIPKKFDIVKFENAQPCVLIDYDYLENDLKIYSTVDYGFKKIRTTKSVFYSQAKYDRGYKRRNGYNYLEKYVKEIDLKNKKINYAFINEKKEIEIFKKIYESDGYYGIGKLGERTWKSSKKIKEFAEIYYPRIKDLGWKIEFEKDSLDFEESNFKADFNIDMDADNDWLYFDVKCYCDKDKVSLKDLKKFVKNKNDFIKMKDGRLLKITNREELERFIFLLDNFYEKEKGGFEGKIYNAPELEDIFTSSKHYNARVADGFKKFMGEIKSGKPIKKIKLPVNIKKTLRDYQKDGIDWLYFLRKYRFAGILADDMGLGKTLQTLVLIQKERVAGKPSMIVCPKTLLYNWQDEVEKFTPDLKVAIIDGLAQERKALIGKASKYDLLVTSYSSLKNDLDEYKNNNLQLNYLVIDEAQFIKNYKTKSARAVKKIDADYRLALTGTPLENNVSEIWSIFDFLMPGFLNTNKSFVNKFQNPIMKNNDAEALKNLRKKIECFMLRRTKKEVLKELPPKIEKISHCQLGKDQNILYQEILNNVKKEIFNTVEEKGFAKSQIHILAALTKLRQVCNHPVLLLKDKNYKKYESAKLDLFSNLIKEITDSNRKVLVFSQFTKMLDILASELGEQNIEYLYLSGKTRNRQNLVKKFNKNGKHKVFLISLKAGGTGLNLTTADNVIIFDPWWNPSVENQAIDRTHRIGQKNSVNVYRLITKGTIEEKIVELQNKKNFLFNNVVGESKDLFQKLTWDDIKSVFN